MNMQVINRNKPTGGFRELTSDEIMMVSGGYSKEGQSDEDIHIYPALPTIEQILAANRAEGGGGSLPGVNFDLGYFDLAVSFQNSDATFRASLNQGDITGFVSASTNGSVSGGFEFGFDYGTVGFVGGSDGSGSVSISVPF